MIGKKALFAAAALAVLSVAGAGSASAAPFDRHGYRNFDRHPGYAMQHRYADRFMIQRSLRPYQYRMIGAPYFVRGQYVVRGHDRFDRPVTVRIDPYSGAYLGRFRF